MDDAQLMHTMHFLLMRTIEIVKNAASLDKCSADARLASFPGSPSPFLTFLRMRKGEKRRGRAWERGYSARYAQILL